MMKLVSAFLLTIALLAASPAQAQLRVPVNAGKIEPVPIAISPFYPERPEFAQFAIGRISMGMAVLSIGSGVFLKYGRPISATMTRAM